MKVLATFTFLALSAVRLLALSQEQKPSKAESVIPSLRAAEKVLQKSTDLTDMESLLATIGSLDLMTEDRWAMVTVKTFSASPDGTLLLQGEFDPQRGSCQFMTPEELDEQTRWEEKAATLKRRHSEELRGYDRVEYVGGAIKTPRKTGGPPVTVLQRQEQEKRQLEHTTQIALRPIAEAVAERKSEWSRVQLILSVPSELAESLSRDKMMKTSKVKLTFRIREFEVSKGYERTRIPAHFGLFSGELIDVDSAMKKKQPAGNP